jgi:hypothetical protein
MRSLVWGALSTASVASRLLFDEVAVTIIFVGRGRDRCGRPGDPALAATKKGRPARQRAAPVS